MKNNQPKVKKIPMRKCMGCMQMFPKKELCRVVKTKTGENEDDYVISLDLTGKKNGRGAYVCKNLDCLKKARKARRFERVLDCAIGEDVFDEMENELKNE